MFLAIGGLFGLSVALTRWPAVHLLPADWFYLALTAHGLDVLLLWIIFFEIAVLYFAVRGAAELPARGAALGLGGLRAHAGRRAHDQRRGAAGRSRP